jgi:hypothetical protein
LLNEWLYMIASVTIANWRPDDPSTATEANLLWESLTTGPVRRPPETVEADRGAFDYGQQVRSVLEQFMTGSQKVRQALREIRDAAIEHVRVASTELVISKRDTLEHLHGYFTGTGDGPLGLFLTYLMDPGRPFGQNLRRCRLASCGRVFFVPPVRRGGPIPAYCPGTDHQRRADAMKAARRSKEYRARQAVRAAAKHK